VLLSVHVVPVVQGPEATFAVRYVAKDEAQRPVRGPSSPGCTRSGCRSPCTGAR